ncbi:hypothetical protein [Sphingomonas phage Carli]|nr:hypothetical protein [Sphingomonas phage Carli]
MTTGQSSTRHADTDVWGVCSVCRALVIYGDRYTHPCENYHVDTSWNALANPHNTPWFPGYRFYCEQDSGARTRHKSRGWITPRRYKVEFEITEDGKVRHVRGVKPTEALQRSVEEMYLRERPGSNWYPGCEDL